MCIVRLETFVSFETILNCYVETFVNCDCYMCFVACETIPDAGFDVIMYVRCYM
jgi:hypothetical protein